MFCYLFIFAQILILILGVCYPAKTFQQYYDEIIRLQKKNDELEAEVQKCRRGLKFVEDDRKCLFYTGISSYETFFKLFKFLEPSLDQPVCNLSKDQLLVLTLTRLRLNTSLSSLAYDYNSSLTTISKYFHRTLYQIHESLKWANFPTEPEIAVRHLPQNFQSKFGNKRIFIVDCFEIFCQNPSDLKAATSLYSNYKKHETIKYMIAIHPDGNIAFISSGYNGRISDKEIFKKSGILDHIVEDDIILADKGFEIADLVAEKKAVLNIPNFLRKKTQFSLKELDENKQVTQYRIHVERAIGVIREKFSILSAPISVNTMARYQNGLTAVDLIVKVSCILYSLNKKIIT